jgi:ABC-2 type transport system permease protein
MPAVTIALKDLLQRIRDRSAFLWGIVAPFGLAFVFSMILGNVADPSNLDVSYAVADLDGGEMARVFVEEILRPISKDGPLGEEGFFDLEVVADEETAEIMAENGDVDAAFVIPSGFSDAVTSGAPAAVSVIGNVSSATLAEVAHSIASGYADEVNAVRTSIYSLVVLEGEMPDETEMLALVDEAQAEPTPLVVGDDPAASKMLSAPTFYSAGMAIMFLFLAVQFGVLGLLEEKQNGTLARLLAAPITKVSIVGGKALTSFVIGITSMTVLVVGTTYLLDASWGNSMGVAILVLAGVFSAMGIMFLIAAFAKTPEQAGNLQAIIAFLLAMLGGTFFPVYQMGGILGRLSLLTPHAWFLRGLGDLVGEGTVSAVFPAALYVVAFGVVTGLLAQFRLGKAVAP